MDFWLFFFLVWFTRSHSSHKEFLRPDWVMVILWGSRKEKTTRLTVLKMSVLSSSHRFNSVPVQSPAWCFVLSTSWFWSLPGGEDQNNQRNIEEPQSWGRHCQTHEMFRRRNWGVFLVVISKDRPCVIGSFPLSALWPFGGGMPACVRVWPHVTTVSLIL